MRIDDAVERADLIDAQAAVKLAESETLEKTLDHNLRQRGFDTQSRLRHRCGGGSRPRARAACSASRRSSTRSALKAPFDGIIGIPRIDPGQYVQPGTIVATLQETIDRMKVNFTVPEQRVAGQVKVGKPFTAFFESRRHDLHRTGLGDRAAGRP